MDDSGRWRPGSREAPWTSEMPTDLHIIGRFAVGAFVGSDPLRFEFAVWRAILGEPGSQPAFNDESSGTYPSPRDRWQDAEPIASGFVRFDGCVNFHVAGPEWLAHVCSRDEMGELLAALKWAVDRAGTAGCEVD